MIRVLEVFGEPISRGGQESYVMNVLQHMDLQEFQVDMFTPYYCDNDNYKCFIESHNGKITAENILFKVGGSRREIIPVFEEYLKDRKYDVVHIHSGSISVLAYCARCASKKGVKKVIVHSHSSGTKENLKHFLIKQYAERLFRKYVTDYCACSQEAARWKYPQDKLGNVKILNNGVDLEVFKYNTLVRSEMRAKYQIKNDEFLIGHVGRFTAEKNQKYLIDILKKYRDLHPEDKARLLLVGDGTELDSVKRRADDLGVINRVIFVGARDNVSDYMQMFDVFAFPSKYEGLGIVGVEAQAIGLPIVASTGIPKSMKITENVKFVELNDMDSWCRDIKQFENIQRKDNSAAIKAAGFDVRDTAKEVEELYRN